jgi:hypothetical protein
MSRRTVFLALGALLATILVLAATSQRSAAQSPPLTKYFSSYARAHRVTIRRNGNIVTTFDVPVGVYISVYSDQEPVRTAQEGRIEFHGNVEIRTLPRGDAVPGDGTDATQLMAKAPLVVAAQNVDVVSETIIP